MLVGKDGFHQGYVRKDFSLRRVFVFPLEGWTEILVVVFLLLAKHGMDDV